MNGISKETFLAAKDSKVRDGILYDLLEGIYKEVSLKRTILVAIVGGVTAVAVMNSPLLIGVLVRLIL